MLRKFLFFAAIFFYSICLAGIKNLSIEKGERIIVFAPHPDDEILGCAGLIQKVLENEGELYVVYLTNGDHNQIPFRVYEKKIILKPADYIKLGEIRRKESSKATEIIGIPEENLIFLGYPDFGCLKIWEDFWDNSKKPFRSFLTRASSVPYKENYSYGKPYFSTSILEDLKNIIQKINPSKIFITSPFDTNVDHRALYNFIRVAILEIENISPEIFIYIIHFKNYPQKQSELLLSVDMPASSEWYMVSLEDRQIKNKISAIDCFNSQTIFKKTWFYAFARKNEIFYKEKDESVNESQILRLESEKEAEFKDYRNLSYPFYCCLKKDNDFLNVEFIQKEKIVMPTNYIFYFYPFRKDTKFAEMPKIKIDLKKVDEILTATGVSCHQNLRYEKLKNRISFRIKISDLNYPDYLFFSTTIKIGGINYDFVPWEVIKIE